MQLEAIADFTRIVDLTGQRFGHLTVIEPAGIKRWRVGMAVYFRCRCDCGVEDVVQRSNLRASAQRSLGCPHERRTGPAGYSTRPEAKVFRHMLDRCTNPHNKSFKDYGGRGIRVCERWRNGEGGQTGFECFVSDLGPRPAGGTIERLDVNKGYCPENCAWVSKAAQARNTRRNIHIEIGGRKLTVAEWARVKRISEFTIYRRLEAGWEPAKAVLSPVNVRKRNNRFAPR